MPRRSRTIVVGADELAKKLDQLPEIVRKRAQATIRDEVEEIADDMRRNAPELTGALKKSIQAEAKDLTGTAAATARHAVFVEHGTSDTPQQPFATPAAERSRRRFPKRLAKEIQAGLKAVTK